MVTRPPQWRRQTRFVVTTMSTASSKSSSSNLPAFLQRHEKADDITDKPAWRIGISMMASYATGVSLMAGMGIVFALGLIPGFAWLFLNGISLGFWGLILHKYPHAKNWFLTLPALGMATLFGFFGPAFNLTALRSLLVANTGNVQSVGFIGSGIATFLMVLVGLGLLLYINKYGIRGSVFTDFWQVCLQFGGVAALIVIGWTQLAANPGSVGFGDTIVLLAEGQTAWLAFLAIWPTLISPFSMSMSWQRFQAAPEEKKFPATLYAAGFFTIYMFMVGIVALLWQPTVPMVLAALLVVIGVGTSSFDSAVALHQYVGQRLGFSYKIGTVASGLAIAIWAGAQTVLPFGVADLWLFTAKIMGPYFLIGMGACTVWYVVNQVAPGTAQSIRDATEGWWWFPENVYVLANEGVGGSAVESADD